MASVNLLEGQLEIPMDVGELAAFRRWAVSDAFPDTGRIDSIRGSIDVDMSPEKTSSTTPRPR